MSTSAAGVDEGAQVDEGKPCLIRQPPTLAIAGVDEGAEVHEGPEGNSRLLWRSESHRWPK